MNPKTPKLSPMVVQRFTWGGGGFLVSPLLYGATGVSVHEAMSNYVGLLLDLFIVISCNVYTCEHYITVVHYLDFEFC